MKRAYFESYLQEHSLVDEWWVSVDNEVLDKLMKLDDVEELEYELPGRVIALLHPAVADDEDCRWVTFDFDGINNLQHAAIIDSADLSNLTHQVKMKDLAADILGLKTEVAELRVQINEIGQMLRDALQIQQMKEELAHRQQFIEAGEEALLAKTIRYEEQIAELDQRREDLKGQHNRAQRTA